MAVNAALSAADTFMPNKWVFFCVGVQTSCVMSLTILAWTTDRLFKMKIEICFTVFVLILFNKLFDLDLSNHIFLYLIFAQLIIMNLIVTDNVSANVV